MAVSTRQNYTRSERIPVLSAIPSTLLTLASLPRRPNPSGSAGKTEALYTNHFPCQFSTNLPLYQYDVAIEELGKTSNQWYEVKGRARCALVMQSLVSNSAFPTNTVVWYDEQKCLYSTSILLTPQFLNTTDGRNRLHIKSQANQWSTNDIQEYITGRAQVYPFDAVRILETLLKKSLENRVQIVNNTCYFVDEKPEKLAGGFEERLGFAQALNLARNQVTLNIQTKLTTFYPEMSLIDFIHLQIGGKRIPNETERKKLNRLLKDCLIVTQQSNWKQAYEFSQFDTRTPNLIRIDSGETLIEYYKTAKNIKLTELTYPCIEVYIPNEYGRPCHLPLQVCRIKAWQIYDKPLSKAQETQQPRKQIPQPAQRYSAIMNTIEKCNYNSPSNRLCREVGFQIQDNEMLQLNGRILTQPQIATGQHSQVNIRIGSIPLNGHLFTPKPISALAITYFGQNASNNEKFMKDFCQTLLEVMKSFHVNVRHQYHTVDSTVDQITRYFQEMQRRQCEFVVCVMDGRNDEELQQIRHHIKDNANQSGLMTQCAVLSKIKSCRSMRNYCENLLRKINYKNSGINTKVNLDQALKNHKSKTDAYMFFGADVIHPTNVTRQHPSIAGSSCLFERSFNHIVSFQRLSVRVIRCVQQQLHVFANNIQEKANVRLKLFLASKKWSKNCSITIDKEIEFYRIKLFFIEMVNRLN